jgi:hypothetical protein
MKNLQQSITERIDMLNKGELESNNNKYMFPFVDYKKGYQITFVKLHNVKGGWKRYL